MSHDSYRLYELNWLWIVQLEGRHKLTLIFKQKTPNFPSLRLPLPTINLAYHTCTARGGAWLNLADSGRARANLAVGPNSTSTGPKWTNLVGLGAGLGCTLWLQTGHGQLCHNFFKNWFECLYRCSSYNLDERWLIQPPYLYIYIYRKIWLGERGAEN